MSRPSRCRMAATASARIVGSGLIYALVALGLTGCDDGDSPLSSGDELLVITGYLFAGEPVGEVEVSLTVPLDSETVLAPPVNDARLGFKVQRGGLRDRCTTRTRL